MAIRNGDKIFNKVTLEIGKVTEWKFTKKDDKVYIEYYVSVPLLGVDSFAEEIWYGDDIIPYSKIDLQLLRHQWNTEKEKLEERIKELDEFIYYSK